VSTHLCAGFIGSQDFCFLQLNYWLFFLFLAARVHLCTGVRSSSAQPDFCRSPVQLGELELELLEPQCRPDFVASSAESLHAYPGALPRRTYLDGLQLVSCLLSSEIAASAIGSVFVPRA
jgi:hypothetical protein